MSIVIIIGYLAYWRSPHMILTEQPAYYWSSGRCCKLVGYLVCFSVTSLIIFKKTCFPVGHCSLKLGDIQVRASQAYWCSIRFWLGILAHVWAWGNVHLPSLSSLWQNNQTHLCISCLHIFLWSEEGFSSNQCGRHWISNTTLFKYALV